MDFKAKAKGLIQEGTELVMALVIVGIMAGAGAIALAAMSASTTNQNAINAIGNATGGIVNFTSQLGTVGTDC